MTKSNIQGYLLAILLAGVSLLVSFKKQEAGVSPIQSYAELQSLWLDPPADYRSAPLWDWNDKISEEGIDFQMKEFKKAGIGGVFVHPRPGLVTEYMSDKWFHLFDFTVKKGKELGMNVWIYDENSYPSGFAGGHVPAEMPDSYRHGTGLSYEIQNQLHVAPADTFEVVLRQSKSGFEDITQSCQSLNGEKGTFYLFRKTYPAKSPWYGGFAYVDLLYPGVTEKFLEVTMGGYEKYNKADFGGTVKGTFTDEPNLEAAMSHGTVVRWTPALWEAFEKRWKYDLKTNLPSLLQEVGNWKKVRHDYYELILEMFVDRWAKPYSAYCEKNNLQLTGHYWEHGWPVPTDGSDESAFYIWHQMPAVDMLGCNLDADGLGGQFGNTRAIRELRSAANQAGRNRTLSETYGGGGYEMDFKNFKRLADWQCVFGVNFVNQHLSYFSMEGVRKFDYPPTFSYHEPWWEDYRTMGDYLARISMATAAGEQINHTLVLQPNTSAWMYFSRTNNNPQINRIGHDFKFFVNQLELKHFEYDLGSEKVLRELASVSGGKLKVGKRSYQLVVLPAEMENMDRNTVDLLSKYLSQGGKILSFRSNIELIDGKATNEISELKNKYADQWQTAGSIEDASVSALMSPADFSIKNLDQNGEFYHQRRILYDGQLLYVVNSSETRKASAKITATGKSVVKVDLFTGEQNLVPTDKSENGISFITQLEPIGSAAYFISKNEEKFPLLKIAGTTSVPVQAEGKMEAKRLSDNILSIDYLDIKTNKSEAKNIHFMRALWGLFNEKGVALGNPWQEKIQYRQNYLDLDTLFKDDSGFEMKYHFKVSNKVSDELIAGLKAVVEHPELWTVSVNGNMVQPKQDAFWIDHHFPVYNIGEYVQRGENTIEVRASRMSIFAEAMPVYVLGDFSLSPLATGFEINNPQTIEPGSWINAGLPYYSQKVAYSQKFKAHDRGSYSISLGQWNGTVCDVIVNGTKAGIIAFPPYSLDITPFVKGGENEVEIQVTGSLKNTFGYFYQSNKKWIHGPGEWKYAPDAPQNLSAMFLMNYGLFEPFHVLQTE
jgi:hypothetical protein